jgi:WD40 repeat protein
LASGSNDSTIIIWDVNKGALVWKLEGHSEWITCLASLLNGLLASASSEMTIKIWNSYSGDLLRTIDTENSWALCLLRLSNGFLASGMNDNTVKIWNPYNGRLEKTLIGHNSWILSMIQINDESFASGSDDSSIILWNTTSWNQIRSMKTYGPVYCLSLLLNGDLISGTTTGYIEFWNADDGLRKKYLSQGNNVIYSLVPFENGDFAVGFSAGEYKIFSSGLNIPPSTIYSSCKLELI